MYQKQQGNGKFSNLRFWNKNVNIVSKTLIICAHEAIPCAPEKGHINGPKINKFKDKYRQKYRETDNNKK